MAAAVAEVVWVVLRVEAEDGGVMPVISSNGWRRRPPLREMLRRPSLNFELVQQPAVPEAVVVVVAVAVVVVAVKAS